MQSDLESKYHYSGKSDLHLSRKIWHVTTVLMMLATYVYAPEKTTFIILFVSMLIFIPIDFIRQFNPKLNDFMVRLMRPFIRKSEIQNLAGTTYLLTGVAILAVFFPRRVIELSMMFLALADPVASYFGIRFGKDRLWGQKSLQGFIAAFVVCFGLSLFYFHWTNMMTDRLILASVTAGMIGAVSELVQIGDLDDNFTLPIISAILLSAMYYFLGATG